MVKLSSQYFCLNVWDVLEDESRCLCGRILQDIVELYDVGSSIESLQDLDLSVLFFDANWLQYFDDTLLIVLQICMTIATFATVSTP